MKAPGPPDDGSLSAKVYRLLSHSADAFADPRDSAPENQGRVNRSLAAIQGIVDPFFANQIGFLIVIYGFALGYGASYLWGYPGGELVTAIGGSLIAITDLGIRLGRHRSNWLARASGGTLFFLPVFLFGMLWIVTGMIDIMAI